jgi:hypothetical protein
VSYGDSFGLRDDGGRHDFWVTPGEVGTPTHIAFHARSREAIDGFYSAALKSGGKDSGESGSRPGYAAYAAFVIDPVGNNVEAVIWKGEPGASDGKRRTAAKNKKREDESLIGGFDVRPRPSWRAVRRSPQAAAG